ncbi:hypothetical protein I4U23_015557 [Adineta vaga]|nr:hypothetical protein I4U23_015557 [Adineta vaga]
MEQTAPCSIETNVFTNQQSVDESSSSYLNLSKKFIVVWLLKDFPIANVNLDSIESEIENSADFLQKYNNSPVQCETYVSSASENQKIFLILPKKHAQNVLQNIHDLHVLHSIYIFQDFSEEQLNDYSKIVNIYTDLHRLINDLCSEVYNCIYYAQLPMTIFKKQYEQDRSFDGLNKFAYFIDFWSPLFIDLLLDLPSEDYEQEKRRFIEQCRIYYRANETVLNDIDEFENTYEAESAIQWFKRDSFVYRLLNKIMRQQNIQGILTIRFYIVDLQKQLNQIHQEYIEYGIYIDNSQVTVYRGLILDNSDFIHMKTNLTLNTILSINTLFSTTLTLEVALMYAGAMDAKEKTPIINQNKTSVIFQIDIQYNHKLSVKQKPFADIGYLLDKGESKFKDECEVLCMVGSFLRVDGIYENYEIKIENGLKTVVTLVTLTLINENDSTIPTMKDYQILKSTKTIEGKIIRIGNLLIDRSLAMHSSRSKADSFYQIFSHEYMATCLTGQAWIALKRNQFDLAIKLAFEALLKGNHSNDEWKITTLNCLGGVYYKQKLYFEALKYYQQAYDISKLTDEKIAKNTYHGPCIAIDKFAMYDNYRNISSINIARIYQERGENQCAWNMYKESVDCEMRDTTDFHCHTCMTIAESGTHVINPTAEEHNRIWKNWKQFLDLGLDDIIKYRTSIITGYLSFNYQYDFLSRRYDNESCRFIAIDYFQKVEKQCSSYVSNYQYYLYTLQCYERLAILYRYSNNQSLDYYEKIIRLCCKYHLEDLQNLTIGYQGMLKCYQQQRTDRSEPISELLCTDSNEIETKSVEISDTFFQYLKPLHFALEFYDKQFDTRVKTENDLRKKMVYCQLKLAALYYDQKKIEEAKFALSESISLCQQIGFEKLNISQICNENLFFIEKKFHLIIQSYLNRLYNYVGYCNDENIYCYIAHLYKKTNDLESTLTYLREPLENFEQYNYICSHTLYCYTKLAEFYQIEHKDMNSTVKTYERAVTLYKIHRSNQMKTMISIVQEHLIDHFKQTDDFKILIQIYQTLCTIMSDDTTDIFILYTQMKRIWKLLIRKYDAYESIIHSYDAFLNLILQILNPLTSQMTMVIDHYRPNFIQVCIRTKHLHIAIQIYQKLIELLFKYSTDMMKIADVYQIIAGEFLQKKLFYECIEVYEHLFIFLCHHPTTGHYIENDKIDFMFHIWKHRIISEYLIEEKYDLGINLYYKMIHILIDYRQNIHSTSDQDEFVSKIFKIYDEISSIYQLKKNFDQAIFVYQEQIAFMIKYQLENIQTQINTIITKCQQFAIDNPNETIEIYSQLIHFIENNRLDYLSHLSTAYNELADLESMNIITDMNSSESSDLNQQVSDYKQKARNYMSRNQFDKAKNVYRQELLPFLLENYARDDEQIGECHLRIASFIYANNRNQALKSYQEVIDIYEEKRDVFYTDYAFELNVNVCRRYAGTLFLCYNCLSTIYMIENKQNSARTTKQKAMNIYEKYQNQFQFAADPLTDRILIERLPFLELNY